MTEKSSNKLLRLVAEWCCHINVRSWQRPCINWEIMHKKMCSVWKGMYGNQRDNVLQIILLCFSDEHKREMFSLTRFSTGKGESLPLPGWFGQFDFQHFHINSLAYRYFFTPLFSHSPSSGVWFIQNQRAFCQISAYFKKKKKKHYRFTDCIDVVEGLNCT